MAITSTQQEQILKYTAGILGVSAGGYMPTLAQYVQDQPDQANATHNLALVLASCPAFKALGFGYSDAATDAQFVAAFLADFLPASITAENVTAAENWMLGMMSNGATRAEVVVAAVEAVAAVAETDTNWGAARSQLDNRTTVATTYTITNSGTSTDLTTLASTIATVTDDDATIDTASGSNTSTSGSSYALTTDIDNIVGTGGNDTIIADAATASAADQVNGGLGFDTLKLYGTAGAVDVPTLSNVEAVSLLAPTASHDFSAATGLTTLTIDDATTAKIFTVAAGVTAFNLSNQIAADTVEIKVAAATTAFAATLNAFGDSTGNALLKLDGAALTTVSLTTATNASYVQLDDGTAAVKDTVTTVNLLGDKAITLDMDTTAFTNIVTVDASANTAGVTAIMEDGTGANVTFTGGTGDDTANFGAKFTKGDVVDGGAGTDVLQMTQASVTVVEGYVAADKATTNDNLAGLEVLEVTDALTSNIDASRFDSINSFVLAAGINNGGTSTLSKVTTGVTVELNADAGTATDILAVAITDATLAGHNSDEVNLVLNDTVVGGGAAVTDYGVLDATGVDILNISSVSNATSTATGNLIDIKATSSALDSVVVTGTLYLDIATVALVNSIAEVDASGMVLTAVTANGLDVAIAAGGTNGVNITGSMGIDDITGSAAADIIDGGTGADLIEGAVGNDVMTGGAGNDAFYFTDADSGITSSAFDEIVDYSNGTTVGTTDSIEGLTGAWVVATTAVAGWTLTAGVLAKSGATLADFLTAAALGDVAQETYAFVSGSDTYVYNNGANDDTSTADDTLIKLTGVVGVSVVTVDTTIANEIFIA